VIDDNADEPRSDEEVYFALLDPIRSSLFKLIFPGKLQAYRDTHSSQ
jgi:hypothetical protein